MLDLNLIEKDFYFDVENKTIKGTQGNNPSRLYTLYELYTYTYNVFDRENMLIYKTPLIRVNPGVYSIRDDWVLDESARVSLLIDGTMLIENLYGSDKL